jgi:hypothetical protein
MKLLVAAMLVVSTPVYAEGVSCLEWLRMLVTVTNTAAEASKRRPMEFSITREASDRVFFSEMPGLAEGANITLTQCSAELGK